MKYFILLVILMSLLLSSCQSGSEINQPPFSFKECKFLIKDRITGDLYYTKDGEFSLKGECIYIFKGYSLKAPIAFKVPEYFDNEIILGGDWSFQ